MENYWLSTILAIALAMDAFAVALTFSTANEVNSSKNKLFTATMFGLFQAMMFAAGCIIIILIGPRQGSLGQIIASLLLGYLGIRMILEYFEEEEKLNFNNKIYKAIILFAIATSIDALLAGASIAITTSDVTYLTITSLIIGIVAFIFTLIGVNAGNFIKNKIGKKSEIFGGIVLLTLAILPLIFR